MGGRNDLPQEPASRDEDDVAPELARLSFARWCRAKKCSTSYELTQEEEDQLNDPRHEEPR